MVVLLKMPCKPSLGSDKMNLVNLSFDSLAPSLQYPDLVLMYNMESKSSEEKETISSLYKKFEEELVNKHRVNVTRHHKGSKFYLMICSPTEALCFAAEMFHLCVPTKTRRRFESRQSEDEISKKKGVKVSLANTPQNPNSQSHL